MEERDITYVDKVFDEKIKEEIERVKEASAKKIKMLEEASEFVHKAIEEVRKACEERGE